MIDITDTIKAKSLQMNADDLLVDPITIKILSVSKNDGEQPISINYEGDDGKPYFPCKQMRRVMVQLWGKDASQYVGRSMTLFRDAKVTWAGVEVGGIRISHMSHIDGKKTLSLTASNKVKKPYVVNPLSLVEKPKSMTIEELRELADDAAKSGIDALKKWFGSLSSDDKKTIQPELDKYKQLATQEKEENNEESL